jgi:acetyl-CoA acetyltransferase
MQEAVIIDCLRTAVGKAPRGALRTSRPDDLAGAVISRLLAKHPEISKDEIEDIVLGCAMPEAESGNNMARWLWLASYCNGGRSHPLRGCGYHPRGRRGNHEYDAARRA